MAVSDYITIPEAFDFAEKLVRERIDKENNPLRSEQVQLPDPVQWIEDHFIDPVSLKKVVLVEHQQRILREALRIRPDGSSVYNLVIWSEPKKSGKTTAAGAVGCYVACNIEAPNEVSCVANDKEQSAGRIFAAMMPTLENLGWRCPPSLKGRLNDPIATGGNGTIVKAITTNYGKEAGANQGLSLWSELWAYKGERLTRLWEEMTPPPTRKFRMRWVESYAGFKHENLLFQNIYLRIFKNFEEPGKPAELRDDVTQIWDDLPVYRVGPMLLYWSHDHLMPWQTKAYYDEQRSTMRKNSYVRLHQNYWVSGDESFITDEMYEAAIAAKVQPNQQGSTFALDGSVNGDLTALVGSKRTGDRVESSYARHWVPTKDNDEGVLEIDYEAVEREIIRLWKHKILAPPLYYDPYQCSYLAQRLREKGLRCIEFKQGSDRVKADTFLYKMFNETNLSIIANPTLKQHIVSANAAKVGKDKEEYRIIKPGEENYETMEAAEQEIRLEKGDSDGIDPAVGKIDLAVSLSMSVYQAYHNPPSSGGWGVSGGLV